MIAVHKQGQMHINLATIQRVKLEEAHKRSKSLAWEFEFFK